MPQGDKSKYTQKQKRQARHIEEGYEKHGVSEKEAVNRAWATVNKTSSGGKKGGTAAKRSSTSRSAAPKKAAATRKARSK